MLLVADSAGALSRSDNQNRHFAQAAMVDPAKAGNTLKGVSEPSVDASKPRAEEDKY